MRLLVLAPSLEGTSPGSRFRVEQWMKYWRRDGVESDYVGFEDEALHRVVYTHGNWGPKAAHMLHAFARRLGLLPGLRRYDAVFLYEEASRIGPAVVERLIHLTGTPIVYDFCDPIYLPYVSPRNRYLSYLKFFGKTATICRLASHVLVGNEELRRYAERHARRITTVPITIDTEEYQPRAWDGPAPAVPIIGWSGSHTTVPHLDTLRPALAELAKRRRFRLRVLGTEGYRIDGVDVECQPWRAATEIADLQSFDVGIMPLPDDRWTRLRTQLKVRQYMGVAVPSVASPVGVNTEVVSDGENGFLAATADDWVTKLTRLLDDPALRRRLGEAGRRTIEERYSATVWAPRVRAILDEAVAGRRRAGPTPPAPPRR